MIQILVVANPADWVQLLVARLRRIGYETTHADSGPAALDRLAAAIPDLVVLAWQLRPMSGAAVCRVLRADERLLGMPILVVGAEGPASEHRAAEALGADDYLAGPGDLDELLQHVRTHVRGAPHAGTCLLTALPTGPAVGAAIRSASLAVPPRTILYVTIDHLARYNATYGMVEGNRLIQLAARVLRQVLAAAAPGSFLGYTGLGEFVILTAPPQTAPIRQTAALHFQQVVAEGGFYPVAAAPPRDQCVTDRRSDLAPGPPAALAFDEVAAIAAVHLPVPACETTPARPVMGTGGRV